MIQENIVGKIREALGGKIISYVKKSERRHYLDLNPEDIFPAVKFLFEELKLRFVTATGIDTPLGIEILYHFSHDSDGKIITLRTLLKDKERPETESIATLFRGAEWIEREMWEMLGVNFRNHPNLKRLLLIDDWPQGNYPLRHDKKQKR